MVPVALPHVRQNPYSILRTCPTRRSPSGIEETVPLKVEDPLSEKVNGGVEPLADGVVQAIVSKEEPIIEKPVVEIPADATGAIAGENLHALALCEKIGACGSGCSSWASSTNAVLPC